MRRQPDPGAAVGLTVTADGRTAADDLAARLSTIDLTDFDRRRFGALRVRTTEASVDEIRSLDGIESIETAATRTLTGGDAGEGR